MIITIASPMVIYNQRIAASSGISLISSLEDNREKIMNGENERKAENGDIIESKKMVLETLIQLDTLKKKNQI